jgi:hypothetical protein
MATKKYLSVRQQVSSNRPKLICVLIFICIYHYYFTTSIPYVFSENQKWAHYIRNLVKKPMAAQEPFKKTEG